VTDRDRKNFDYSFNALTSRLRSYKSTAERRGHHLMSWFQSVWRVIVHDVLLVKAVTHRYVNIAAKLRKRTRLLGHLAFGSLPAWCCNPMARKVMAKLLLQMIYNLGLAFCMRCISYHHLTLHITSKKGTLISLCWQHRRSENEFGFRCQHYRRKLKMETDMKFLITNFIHFKIAEIK
jgi:hypothetical protein